MKDYKCGKCPYLQKGEEYTTDGYCKKYDINLDFYDWWEKCNECIIDTLEAENKDLKERLNLWRS